MGKNVENVDMHEDIITLPPSKAPFSVTLCGISYCDGSYEIYRESSPIYVMEYIVSGSGTVSENGVSFTASAGDVYFLKKNRRHHYYSSKSEPWQKLWFNFSGRLADFVTEAYRLDSVTHVHAPELSVYFERIIEAAKVEPEVAEDKICVIFLELAQHISKLSESAEADGIAGRLKAMLDGASDFNVSLDVLSRELFCSKSHAIREFKNAYGTSPYEYLQQRRIALAKTLLGNTAMQVTEISASLGYYDIHYFSTSFKSRVGITPTQYRKNIGLDKQAKKMYNTKD